VTPENVVIMTLKTQFGGNKSQGIVFVYNSKDSLMKFEPKHRLIKQGLAEKPKVKVNRKTKKELKNKVKKLRGMEKVKAKNFGKKK
jgi:small subunit ribosomal protein S24e